MEFLKIVGLSIVASIGYGLVHDQVTAHLCVEYFSVLHPHILPTNSPTILALAWGVIATWWVGLFLGLFVGISARVGSAPRLTANEMIKPISCLLGVMAVCATIGGLLGYMYPRAIVNWHDVIDLPVWKYPRLNAVWFTHNASYATGIGGGLVLCVFNVVRRHRMAKRTSTA